MDSKHYLSMEVKECKARFNACLEIPSLSENDWLEEKLALFNWWTAALNADKTDSSSLDYRLSLRPDVVDEIVNLLEGLIHALSECEEIDSKGSVSMSQSPQSEDFDRMITSPTEDDNGEFQDMDWEGSQNGSMSDTISSSDDEMDDPLDPYSEQRFYMDTFLDLLLGIHRAIKRSGLKFRNKRADDALVEAEAEFQHMKRLVGEDRALNHPEIDIAEHAARHGQESPAVLEQIKVMIVLRSYFRDEVRLITVQRRLIEANVMRGNRFIYAGQTTRRDRIPPGVHEDESPLGQRKGKTETWVSDASQSANLGQEVSYQNQPAPRIITGDFKNDTEEIGTVRSATQLGSSFTIGGVIGTGSKSARSAVTKMSARVDYLDYPPCPAKNGSFKYPLCPEILSKEYTKKQRWRPVEDRCSRELESLALRILDRAKGVFWWARVVMSYHRSAIELGVSIAELESQVDELPKDTDGLFRPVALYQAAARLIKEPACADAGIPEATEGYGRSISRLTPGLLVPEEDGSNTRFSETINHVHEDLPNFLIITEILLVELDRFNTLHYGDGPHGANMTVDLESPEDQDEYGSKTFLALAVEYDLLSYVEEVARSRSAELFAKKGRPYRDYALRYKRVDERMVRLLLQAGLDPNEPFDAREPILSPFSHSTVWSAFLQYRLKRHQGRI
ncbi:uncharacterized protein PG986_012946 [Apiospora aurea]|uniref:Uncharacterized protein n=1 Tax=Apiospora aurea TaxID=335848 RepID=A0ABR1Q1F2_9PEZI